MSSTRPYEPTSLRASKLLPLDRGARDRPSLRRCDDGEEVDRLTSSDPDLLAWIGDRAGRED